VQRLKVVSTVLAVWVLMVSVMWVFRDRCPGGWYTVKDPYTHKACCCLYKETKGDWAGYWTDLRELK
jgi:hypothetical protein